MNVTTQPIIDHSTLLEAGVGGRAAGRKKINPYICISPNLSRPNPDIPVHSTTPDYKTLFKA